MSPVPDVIALTAALMVDDDLQAIDVLNGIDPDELPSALWAACVALAGCWHVDAVEMGLDDETYVSSILHASHQMGGDE